MCKGCIGDTLEGLLTQAECFSFPLSCENWLQLERWNRVIFSWWTICVTPHQDIKKIGHSSFWTTAGQAYTHSFSSGNSIHSGSHDQNSLVDLFSSCSAIFKCLDECLISSKKALLPVLGSKVFTNIIIFRSTIMFCFVFLGEWGLGGFPLVPISKHNVEFLCCLAIGRFWQNLTYSAYNWVQCSVRVLYFSWTAVDGKK